MLDEFNPKDEFEGTSGCFLEGEAEMARFHSIQVPQYIGSSTYFPSVPFGQDARSSPRGVLFEKGRGEGVSVRCKLSGR